MTHTGVINVLDKHTSELIAAGEVVERPASVIKELVENAIDAGAHSITVEIKNGGTTFMRVTDDGCGISRDDVRVAFLRHATSKVKTEDDLTAISTLGFRGEALASISAVSKLQLITKNKNEEIGTTYEINGGEEASLDEAGCPTGTTFVVRDLFYNIPARAKFLKKDVSEGNAVSNIIDKTALSHPEIAFTYIRDGKTVLKTYGDNKLISAIYCVFGKDFANGLIPVDYSLDAIKVRGYISKPEHARPNRNMQNFFINGRYVRSRTAMAALEEAFKGSIMVGKFPSCVLQIELPYEMIDVNVHPSKIEVRFINERPVFDAVYHSVKSSLMKNDSRKQAIFNTPPSFNETKKFNPFKNAPAIIGKDKEKPENKKPDNSGISDEFNPFEGVGFKASENKKAGINSLSFSDSATPFDIFSRQAVKNSQREQSYKQASEKPKEVNVQETAPPEPVLIEQNDVDIRYIGEAFNTYIIAEKNEKEILIIDKHAAHERMIYEKLKSENAAGFSQILLAPVAVTLGKGEYNAAVNNIDMFEKCGFEIEDFGSSTVLVRSAPQYLDVSDIEDCVAEMSDYIASGKQDIAAEKMDWFYHNVACRSAIKAGNTSTPRELIDIVKKLEENPQLKYCPHGRPICVVMTKSEIEKQFGRT